MVFRDHYDCTGKHQIGEEDFRNCKLSGIIGGETLFASTHFDKLATAREYTCSLVKSGNGPHKKSDAPLVKDFTNLDGVLRVSSRLWWARKENGVKKFFVGCETLYDEADLILSKHPISLAIMTGKYVVALQKCHTRDGRRSLSSTSVLDLEGKVWFTIQDASSIRMSPHGSSVDGELYYGQSGSSARIGHESASSRSKEITIPKMEFWAISNDVNLVCRHNLIDPHVPVVMQVGVDQEVKLFPRLKWHLINAQHRDRLMLSIPHPGNSQGDQERFIGEFEPLQFHRIVDLFISSIRLFSLSAFEGIWKEKTVGLVFGTGKQQTGEQWGSKTGVVVQEAGAGQKAWFFLV
ncbi:hypothetical protein Tco_0525966 [Tanacetum coccineum]